MRAPGLRAAAIARNGLVAPDNALRTAQIDRDITEIGPLDDTVHDFGDAILVFLVLALALGFTHFLHDHLLGGLRGDTAEINRGQRIDDKIANRSAFLHSLRLLRRYLSNLVLNFVDHFEIPGKLDVAALAVDFCPTSCSSPYLDLAAF